MIDMIFKSLFSKKSRKSCTCKIIKNKGKQAPFKNRKISKGIMAKSREKNNSQKWLPRKFFSFQSRKKTIKYSKQNS